MSINDHDMIKKLQQENHKLREALDGVITPALVGLIYGDDESERAADSDAIDVTGNGFKCQIVVKDIRVVAELLGRNPSYEH